MRSCLFCEKTANSLEHIIADWILKELPEVKSLHLSLGDSPTIVINTTERTSRCVCNECNEGWMHDTEEANIPLIKPMLHGEAITLNLLQQWTLANWAVKTSMVGEAVVRKGRNLCYSQEQREVFRTHSNFPELTVGWIGKFFAKSLSHFATDIWLTIRDVPKAGNGCVSTFVMGHLVLQLVTLKVPLEHRIQGESAIGLKGKVGPWEELLVPFWPADHSVQWPPPLTFTDDGGILTIARLLNRWKDGLDVSPRPRKNSR